MHPGRDGPELCDAANCEGLGVIGRNQTTSETLGLHLHLTLAVTGAGLPLGVLRCGFDAPPVQAPPPEDAAPRAALAQDMTRHKTQRWLDGLRDIEAAASSLSRKTRVISVMDREADFFEMFDTQRRLDRVECSCAPGMTAVSPRALRSCSKPCVPAPPTATSRSRSTG